MSLAIPPLKLIELDYTASTTIPAPAAYIEVKLIGQGGSGGGGHATGGGGGGGSAGPETDWMGLPCTLGATLTITVPVAQAGGAIGANGNDGTLASVTGGLITIPSSGYGARGFAGGAVNGGTPGNINIDPGANLSLSGPSGGAAAGGNSTQITSMWSTALARASTGGAGAGTGSGGGGSSRPFTQTALVAGGANIGGGAGGCTGYGLGGVGGATSVAGTAAASTAYGCGGGGGGQNAAGGASAPGLVRIRYWG